MSLVLRWEALVRPQWRDLLFLTVGCSEWPVPSAVICHLLSCCSWIVADSVSAALAESAEELASWRKTLLRSCIQWLAVSFSGREPEDENTQEQEKTMLLRLSELLVSVSP